MIAKATGGLMRATIAIRTLHPPLTIGQSKGTAIVFRHATAVLTRKKPVNPHRNEGQNPSFSPFPIPFRTTPLYAETVAGRVPDPPAV